MFVYLCRCVSCLCVSVCVYVSVYVCVCLCVYMSVFVWCSTWGWCTMCVHAEATRRYWAYFSVTLYRIALRQALSLNWKSSVPSRLTSQKMPGIHLSLLAPNSRIIDTDIVILGFLCGCWGFEHISSCLHREYSYPLSLLSSPLLKSIIFFILLTWLILLSCIVKFLRENKWYSSSIWGSYTHVSYLALYCITIICIPAIILSIALVFLKIMSSSLCI